MDTASAYARRVARFAVPLLLVCGAVFSYGLLFLERTNIKRTSSVVILTLAPVVCVALIGLAWRRRRDWLPAFEGLLEEHTGAIDALPERSVGLMIALAAGLGLYSELMVIRFHSSSFLMFSFFKNISLFSCFLGLGVGYSLAWRRPLTTPLILPLLAAQLIFMHFFRHHGGFVFLRNPIPEQLTFGILEAEHGKALVQLATTSAFLIGTFVFNAVCFVPFGQLAAYLMLRRKPLVSYSWNLVGSLAGIMLFTLISFAGLPPAVWVLVPILGIALFARRQARNLWLALLSGAALLAFLGISFVPTRISEIYSPYQTMSLDFVRSEPPVLHVSNMYYQKILDLRPEAARSGEAKMWADYYGLPYRFKPDPESVLVVGAGTGNDVASALRHNAGHVDAVEIDPKILEIGKRLHPESPYDSPKVTSIVNDARAFIRHSARRYDLIVYGLLDSKTILSGMSGIRLDSYVYTVESFREARAKLKPGGILCLTFSLPDKAAPALGRKFFLMLKEAFDGRDPAVYETGYDGGYSFVIGENAAVAAPMRGAIRDVTAQFAASEVPVSISTDDWPFVYMPLRQYPISYLVMIVALSIVSLAFIGSFLGKAGAGFSAPAFFLGAGFMLLEAKAITELALAYGSTWFVVAVVIAAILGMAFLANWLTMILPLPPAPLAYGLLLISILGGLYLTSARLAALGPWTGRILLTVILTLPLFFSGFAFSNEIKKSASAPMALSSNLMGAMLGGFLEYNSMYFGYRALYFLAMAMYGLAFLSALRRPKMGRAA